jgi:arylsulfatase A-like enzyme
MDAFMICAMINQRISLRSSICVFAAGLAFAILGGCTPSESRNTNLVMICIDTVRFDVFLHPELQDDLTAWLNKAQRYNNTRSTAPWTVPAVATVMTGLYPAQHAAGRFKGPIANLAEETPTVLHDDFTTIAEVLRDTEFTIKAFVAHPWVKSTFGLNQGFEALDSRKGLNNIFSNARDWIASVSNSERFFAYLHLMDAHNAQRSTPELINKRFAKLDTQTLQFLNQHTNLASCKKMNSVRCLKTQAYMLTLLEVRQAIAELLDNLSQTGRLDNTVVLVWSDHGEEFLDHKAQHQEMQTDPRNIYGRGHGQNQFDVLLHVPLIAWVPGRPGRVHDDLVSLVDVFPSLMSWLDVDYSDERWPGIVLPSGDAGTRAENDRVIYASNVAYGPESIAVINDRIKAMYWPDSDQFMFFDRLADPQEKSPISSDELILEFSALAGDYLEMRSQLEDTVPDLRADQVQELKAIGYLQGVENEAESTSDDMGSREVTSDDMPEAGLNQE